MKANELDPIVIVGHAIRLPGGVDSVSDFERLLYDGRSAIDEMPAERYDRELYFDPQRGLPGKAYTELGGCVSTEPLDEPLERTIKSLGTYDLTHRQFAQVAVKAWNQGLDKCDVAARCGVYVGHSGGTEQGGPIAMSGLAEIALDHLCDLESLQSLAPSLVKAVASRVSERIRSRRPARVDDTVRFNTYSAASLVSRLLSLEGPREVIDAACASSLLGLSHAVMAIRAGRIDAAIVGGATYNNIDNLILFSQSQACSDKGSCPFDQAAGGLISSEGYVAITITRKSLAIANQLSVFGELRGVGVASDGRGKSLWAPRTEGQQLAIRRGYASDSLSSVDYLEAHATSTQVGDATEIQSLTELLKSSSSPDQRLLVGSVKSNLGHTLEAAGLVGLVKLIIAMRRGEIPPTIHLHHPNSDVLAASDKIQVVADKTPWPSRGRVKRGAVNAFGIGGLNGHAVIESASTDRWQVNPSRSVSQAGKAEKEPIAIVGRGVVLPGAFNVNAFKDLLASDRSEIVSAPEERWRAAIGVSGVASPFHVPTCRGGFIQGYRFDGQPYRIPPKQVQMANPVQMMLIDAVAQAAQEADGGRWAFDRQKTSVVIGTIFGGEFSNQLQVGLRLPEICREVRDELIHMGNDPVVAEKVAQAYRALMLKRYPALLDETGGFTASTLASRIAKSFDLMGGACSIDSDDASGALALLQASEQLWSGESDAVICGVAQRSLDLVAFKDFQVKDRLLVSGRVEDIPADCSKVLPGEGVAVVLLRRLSDATRDGMKVLGVIDAFEFGTKANAMDSRHADLAKDDVNQQIVKRIGYLAGAHSLVRLVAETIRWDTSSPVTTDICATAEDGFFVRSSVRHPKASVKSMKSKYTGQRTPLPQPLELPNASLISMKKSPNSLKAFCLEGGCERDFGDALRSAIESPETAFEHGVDGGHLPVPSPQARFCGGIIVQTQDAFVASLKAMNKAWHEGKRAEVLDRHLAVLWDRSGGKDRIAWAFPGQGAQYFAIPELVQQDRAAGDYLDRFDELLSSVGLVPIKNRLDDPDHQLGHDVWWTQVWVLAVSAALADSLGRAGLRPDLVFGHSFGECGAAIQAGVMSLPQAIRFAKQRSDAVVMTTRDRGQLLSVRGAPSRVDAMLRPLGLNLYITHHNAPEQTVVAGAAGDIAAARSALSSASIASVVIPVPAAFHSPAMAEAKRVLKANYGGEQLRPPKTGFFSMIQGRYLAESEEIRDGLIDQLTQPLLYCSGVERVVRDGCGLIVDVGPSDMLNRLHRSTVGDHALCIALDSSGHTHQERLALVGLASCIVARPASAPMSVGLNSQASDAPVTQRFALSKDSSAKPLSVAMSTEANDSLDFVDVTRRKRVKGPSSIAEQPVFKQPVAKQSVAKQPVANNLSEQTTVKVLATPVQSQVLADSGLVDQFLLDLVVERTGYDPEVIDFEADLEAELGVDSIKKAQLIGELAEWASLVLDLRTLKLSQFRSLSDIRALATQPSTESSQPAVSYHHPKSNGIAVSESAVAAPSVNIAQLESLMVDFIVDQTGYAPDVIDMEADLEGELGVDSIKKAQLLGELVSHYDLSAVDLRRVRLANFPSLGSIRDFVWEHVAPQQPPFVAVDSLQDLKKKRLDAPYEPSLMPQANGRSKT
jgi:acyl transferase domain-containing protein